jgi:hypothetical protein
MSSLRHRWLSIGLGVALTILSAATSAIADDIIYSIAGVEIGFDETSSSFAGTALADDDVAVWDAVVVRTPFDPDRNALITGGTIRIKGLVRDLQGMIDGGTITNLNKTCRRETFAIQAAVTLVGGGSGEFQGTLVHYGRRVHGQCVIFFATVDGSVTFILP